MKRKEGIRVKRYSNKVISPEVHVLLSHSEVFSKMANLC